TQTRKEGNTDRPRIKRKNGALLLVVRGSVCFGSHLFFIDRAEIDLVILMFAGLPGTRHPPIVVINEAASDERCNYGEKEEQTAGILVSQSHGCGGEPEVCRHRPLDDVPPLDFASGNEPLVHVEVERRGLKIVRCHFCPSKHRLAPRVCALRERLPYR